MAEEREGGVVLTEIFNEFRIRCLNSNRKKVLFIISLSLIALGAFFLTLGFGVYNISLFDSLGTFFNHIFGNIVNSKNDHYVWDVRLPRAIGAMIVGFGLAVGGVVMQNNVRNPLADPYTMGISSGAFLGAVISMVLGIYVIPTFSGDTSIVINAFIFSMIPTAIIMIISKFKKMTPTMIILLGIAVMFIFSSICQLILVGADSESLSDAYSWRVGTLAKITWNSLPVMLVSISVISFILFLLHKKLDVMYMGDKNAQSLGVNTNRLRIVTMALISFMTAAIVSYTGTIGFIGLVGPHIARIFVGSSNKYLIPAAGIFGATFIILADTLAKVTGVNGLPVGVISAMIGGPLFIYILIRQRKNVWM